MSFFFFFLEFLGQSGRRMDYVAKCPPTGTEMRYFCEQLGNVLTDGRWYSMPVIETCVFHRQRVTSNQYLDFSFIRHTSIHDDSVLVCLSAATLVYFCYCCLQGGRRDGLSFQIEGLAVSLFLSLSRFLAVDASSSS